MSLFKTMKGIDIGLLVLCTIPVIAIFLVMCIIYFTCIDKRTSKSDPDFIKHGLSRFIMGGIFFIFGLILFDEVIEFISAFATSYLETYYTLHDTSVVFKLTDSILFKSLCAAYRDMPIDILINGEILATALYTSTEGIIAGLKTMNIDSNLAIELPAKKRKRVSAMFLVWCYLAVISTVYKVIIGSDVINFYTSNIYVGSIVTLAILLLAERAPSILSERKTGRVVKVVDEDNVVDYETYTSTNKSISKTESIVGDHCTTEELQNHFNDVEEKQQSSIPVVDITASGDTSKEL